MALNISIIAESRSNNQLNDLVSNRRIWRNCSSSVAVAAGQHSSS